MDANKIFSLFDNDSGVLESKIEISNSLDDLKNNPVIKIGMFTKLILNHQVFHYNLEKFLKKEEPTYNIESTKESSEFIVFDRAWFYINQIDISQKEDVDALLNFNPKTLNSALENAIIYFENREEYIKCAHIFKIQQILSEDKI